MNNSKEILVFGDVMLDEYITGKVERISPEAPVPVLKATNDTFMIGGAGNVANNLSSIGANVSLLGMIGQDLYGGKCLESVKNAGIHSHLVRIENFQTTVKTRIISQNQQIVRIDREEIIGQTPALFDKKVDEVLNQFKGEIIIISDYAKGVCNTKLCQKVISAANNNNLKVLVDPKGTSWEKYKGAWLVKPNIRELEELLFTRIENDDEQILMAARKVIEKYDFENVLVTRSNRGMTLVNKHHVKHFPVDQIEIYDVSGAGDTAIAVLAHVLQQEVRLEKAIKVANLASRYVVSKPNTYAITTSELNLLL